MTDEDRADIEALARDLAEKQTRYEAMRVAQYTVDNFVQMQLAQVAMDEARISLDERKRKALYWPKTTPTLKRL